jgi:hypothetical protein
MSFPFVPVFLALFLAYLVYSVWADVDPRYPIVAALVLLVATAVVDVVGDLATANTLAEYVFFLLAGGVALLVVEHFRANRRAGTSVDALRVASQGEATEPPQERQGTSGEPLDRVEQESVPVVDAAGEQDEQHEQQSDREPNGHEEEVAHVPG